MSSAEGYRFSIRDPITTSLAGAGDRRMRFGSAVLSWPRNGGDCRVCAAAGERWLEDALVGRESERDLAAMVSDFLEEGSGGGSEASRHSSSDSDSSGCSDLGHLAERVLNYKRAMDQCEGDLLTVVRSLLTAINESELHPIKADGQCNGSCIRQLLVKQLRVSGYDAAACSSKWQGFDKVPGGDHDYIDVVLKSNLGGGSDRLIVDIDFRSHFEIARAIESYDRVLSSLPVVYVGSLARLKQFLPIMVDAAKYSLRQNSMPLPPWRSLAYLQAKWQAKYDRMLSLKEQGQKLSVVSSDHTQCIGRLRRLKSSLQSEVESERLLKPITNDKKRMMQLEKRRQW